MKVDRSNYSKAVNTGPITNAFLRKFYEAFGDELDEKPKEGASVEERKEELLKRLETLEQQLDQLIETTKLITRQVEQLIDNTGLLVKASQAGVEALLTRVARKDRGSNNS